jgi:hypothetical protein
VSQCIGASHKLISIEILNGDQLGTKERKEEAIIVGIPRGENLQWSRKSRGFHTKQQEIFLFIPSLTAGFCVRKTSLIDQC